MAWSGDGGPLHNCPRCWRIVCDGKTALVFPLAPWEQVKSPPVLGDIRSIYIVDWVFVLICPSSEMTWCRWAPAQPTTPWRWGRWTWASPAGRVGPGADGRGRLPPPARGARHRAAWGAGAGGGRRSVPRRPAHEPEGMRRSPPCARALQHLVRNTCREVRF